MQQSGVSPDQIQIQRQGADATVAVAFASFRTYTQAEAARQALVGRRMWGWPVRVMWSKDSRPPPPPAATAAPAAPAAPAASSAPARREVGTQAGPGLGGGVEEGSQAGPGLGGGVEEGTQAGPGLGVEVAPASEVAATLTPPSPTSPARSRTRSPRTDVSEEAPTVLEGDGGGEEREKKKRKREGNEEEVEENKVKEEPKD